MSPDIVRHWSLYKKVLFSVSTIFIVSVMILLINPAGLVNVGWMTKVRLIGFLGINYGVIYLVQLLFFSYFFREDSHTAGMILF